MLARAVIVAIWLALLPLDAGAFSRTWLVFFDDGSDEIGPRGEARLAEAARSYLDRRAPTDTERRLMSGPLRPGIEIGVLVDAHAQDNVSDQCALSLRRGALVRARLAALGIPPDHVVVQPFGDRRLLVQTPPGSTDVQNRRVELWFVDLSRLPRPAPGRVHVPTRACR
jgi:outer membrane protein OmpA-like peptidoglycan-associated protein